MTAIEEDLALVAAQEEALRFDAFGLDKAWELGALLREMAVARGHGVVIDVHLNGMPVFYTALDGSIPDNANWVRRKRNVVMRFFRSSYAIGLSLSQQGFTLEGKFGLPPADYAAHGGSFPIVVNGAGCIGAVTVSGLPQRRDHGLAVEALASLAARNHDDLRLTER